METKPEILDTRLVAKSRLFGIESVHLRFSNGEEREFERLRTPPIAGVMCVPMLDNDTVVLIREYGAGVEDYQLTLPKGAYEHGEDWRDAANRELKEEAGYGARTLTHLKDMTLSPGYMGHTIRIALAEDLYEETLPGDEPEPLERSEERRSSGYCRPVHGEITAERALKKRESITCHVSGFYT